MSFDTLFTKLGCNLNTGMAHHRVKWTKINMGPGSMWKYIGTFDLEHVKAILEPSLEYGSPWSETDKNLGLANI